MIEDQPLDMRSALDLGLFHGAVKNSLLYICLLQKQNIKFLCAATCEVVWLRRLLQDVGEERKEPTMIKCDNQSSINIAKNSIFHARTKHVEAQYHFVREKLQSNEITLMYCNTSENVADIFTKPPGKIKFELFREMLGVEVNPFSITYFISQIMQSSKTILVQVTKSMKIPSL
jgi:hypothetical protein